MGNQNQRPRGGEYGDFTADSQADLARGGGGREGGGGAGKGSGDSNTTKRQSRRNGNSDNFSSVLPDSSVRRVHEGAAVTCLAPVSPVVVLSGAKDGSAALFDFFGRKTLHYWKAHDKEVTGVEMLRSKDGAQPPFANPRAISCSRDKTVKVWSLDRSEPLRVLSGHALVVTSISVSPEVTHVASGSRDNSVRLWDVETGSCVAKNHTSRNLVTDIQWSPDGKFLLQTSEDKEVKVLDSTDLSVVRTFPRKTQIQTSVDVSPDCRRVATSSNGFESAGCELTLWDLAEGKVLHELRGHTETTNSVKFFNLHGQSSEFLASASNDCTLRVWDPNSKDTLGKLYLAGSGPLTAVGTFSDGTLVVSSFNSGVYVTKFDPNPDWTNQALVLTSNY